MKRKRPSASRRQGAVLIFVAAGLIVFFGFSALAFDMSYLYLIRADLQVAATAAATELPDEILATALALEYAEKNMTQDKHGTVLTSADVVLGNWDYESRAFSAGDTPTNTVRVIIKRADANANPVSLFFANIFGHNKRDLTAQQSPPGRPATSWSCSITRLP